MGLHQALPDAEIVGVDIKPMPRYPFRFELADAMTYPLEGFDLIWASPPCQGYSIMRNLPWLRDKVYPMLIGPVRERLRRQPAPWIIENVEHARRHPDGVRGGWLCGTMFGLSFYRHRIFETSFPWLMPGHPSHQRPIHTGRLLKSRARDIVFSDAEDAREIRSWPGRRGNDAGHGLTTRQQGNGAQKVGVGVEHAAGWRLAAEAMEIDWMDGNGLTQAIPPAYSRYLAQFIPGADRQQEAK